MFLTERRKEGGQREREDCFSLREKKREDRERRLFLTERREKGRWFLTERREKGRSFLTKRREKGGQRERRLFLTKRRKKGGQREQIASN